LIPSLQVPPFKHGFDKQSLILVWHFVPSKPVPVQSHVYVFISSMHWPLFLQAPIKQSSILLSQFVPLNPVLQLHVYAIIYLFNLGFSKRKKERKKEKQIYNWFHHYKYHHLNMDLENNH